MYMASITLKNIEVDGIDTRVEEVFLTLLGFIPSSHSDIDGQTKKLLRKFPFHHLLDWNEAMSLLGSIPLVVNMRGVHMGNSF